MTGRGKHAGVGDIFQDVGSGSSSLWIGELSDDPPHGLVPGDLSEQVGLSGYRKKSVAALGRNLVVTPLEGGDGGGNLVCGFGGGGGIRLEEEEYGRAVLLILVLCEEVVKSPGVWVSKQ